MFSRLPAAKHTNSSKMAAHTENLSFPDNSVKSTKKLCKFCEKRNGIYTCPKCNGAYCSVECYKHVSHVECTEKFYKNCVQAELKTLEVSDEARQKMLEILAKEKEKQEEIEDEELPKDTIDARMAGVDLDDDKAVWERLSDVEKAEFAEMIKQQRVEQFLPIWQPWWMTTESLVVDVEAESQLSHPEILKEIPKINVQASPNVRFNIINVLSSYVCTTKYFNGDHFLLTNEAAETAVRLSRNIERNDNFDSVKSAVYSVVQMASDANFGALSDAKTILSLVEDLIRVVKGPKTSSTSNLYVLSALSDLYNLFRVARKSEMTKSDKNLLIKSEKKILFYLHWLQNNGVNVVNELEALRDINILEAEVNKMLENA